MKTTPRTPNTGVEERQNRVGQDRPSGTVDSGISGIVVAESARFGPPRTIGLEQARELKIVFTDRKGRYDADRLFMALSMLISEKDFIDYFRKQKPVRIAGTIHRILDQTTTTNISKSDNYREVLESDAS